jgi:uncharacterized protein YdiU (UPF0061 family)
MEELSAAVKIWNFDNSYSRLPGRFFSRVLPQVVRQPRLIRLNRALAIRLGIELEHVDEATLASVFSGNVLAQGAETIAQAYAGHQFGHFVLSLGDGRAILLGEHLTANGERYDIQLKGAGRTPFSRRGDGRAALGPMMREFIIGEALHGLGIPTTRCLALVTTGEEVHREQVLSGAIATRVAASHVRIGTFEYFSARDDREAVTSLAEYVINRHYPEVPQGAGRYVEFCRSFFERQAQLMARWIDVGFVHGVMNTDNIALSGESIDFGPCAFIDVYDPSAVFSSIDTGGRYAFAAQPEILHWNLARFAESTLFLLDSDEEEGVRKAQALLDEFWIFFQRAQESRFRAKFGLLTEERDDRVLMQELLSCMQEQQLDFTQTFRELSRGLKEGARVLHSSQFATWFQKWRDRVSDNRNQRPYTETLAAMSSVNPARIARNHRVEEVIAAGVTHGDFDSFDRLLGALKDPYCDSPELSAYEEPPPAGWGPYRTFCGT